MNPKLLARYILRETMGIVMLSIALFWSAGRVSWLPAWGVIAIMLGWILATAVVILRTNPDLLAERLGPRKGAKKWDTLIMSILGLTQLARYIVAGLDERNGWSGDFPVGAQIVALGVCMLGYALVVWAMASNAYFSQVVRLQTERGQTVASGGPYRYVRHPAYIGAIVYELAVAVLLGSWWALAVGAFNTLLLILRTALEDRALQKELEGYADFARRIKFRLLPGVW